MSIRQQHKGWKIYAVLQKKKKRRCGQWACTHYPHIHTYNSFPIFTIAFYFISTTHIHIRRNISAFSSGSVECGGVESVAVWGWKHIKKGKAAIAFRKFLISLKIYVYTRKTLSHACVWRPHICARVDDVLFRLFVSTLRKKNIARGWN